MVFKLISFVETNSYQNERLTNLPFIISVTVRKQLISQISRLSEVDTGEQDKTHDKYTVSLSSGSSSRKNALRLVLPNQQRRGGNRDIISVLTLAALGLTLDVRI